MPNPRFRRACTLLAAAALPSALVPLPASAAMLVLQAGGDDEYQCVASVRRADGYAFTAATATVFNDRLTYIYIGSLPENTAEPDSDPPMFKDLRLRCWIGRHRTPAERARYSLQSYAIDLYRWESCWLSTDPATGLTHANVPSNELTVWLTLATVDVNGQPDHIDIVRAWSQAAFDANAPQQPYDMLDIYHRLSAE